MESFGEESIVVETEDGRRGPVTIFVRRLPIIPAPRHSHLLRLFLKPFLNDKKTNKIKPSNFTQ